MSAALRGLKAQQVQSQGNALGSGLAALSGRVFKIQKKSRTVLSPIASGEACAHDKRTKREKERPERAASS